MAGADFNMLKQSIDRLSSKFSTTIPISGNSSILTKYFDKPILLNPELSYKACLMLFSVFNTPQLVNSTNNKLRYSKDAGVTWKTITFPSGAYVINEFNTALETLLTANGDWVVDAIVISADNPTSRFIIKLATNYRVDFTAANSLRIILGFDSRIISAASNLGDRIGNIENNLRMIYIVADFINGGYTETSQGILIQSGVIYRIPAFSIALNQKIIERPLNPTFFPINKSQLSSITVKILDQNMNVVDFGGQSIDIELQITQV